MAQTIKLKRTSVQGKIPSTSNLDLGELAINTYDGRIFFEKDDGTFSIQEIFTTDSNITGSLNLNGAITASSLQITGNTIIDGNLTLGGNITIGDSTTDSISVSADFSSSLIPDSGSTYDLGSSSKPWNEVHADTIYGDGSGLTGISVDQVASVTASFSNQSTINVSHNFDTRNVLVSTYDSSYNELIPQTVSLTDSNTVQIVLSSANSGHVVVAKGGHVVSGSIEATNISGLGDEIQTLTSYRQDVTGASFYTITHNLDERYPFVQAWNTSNNTQEQPLDIESTSVNVISVSFSGNFEGKIIVKK